MTLQGGWCWRFWEHGGELVSHPFWCHHSDCRDAEAEAAHLTPSERVQACFDSFERVIWIEEGPFDRNGDPVTLADPRTDYRQETT